MARTAVTGVIKSPECYLFFPLCFPESRNADLGYQIEPPKSDLPPRSHLPLCSHIVSR